MWPSLAPPEWKGRRQACSYRSSPWDPPAPPSPASQPSNLLPQQRVRAGADQSYSKEKRSLPGSDTGAEDVLCLERSKFMKAELP